MANIDVSESLVKGGIAPLSCVDPEVFDLIKKEKHRQVMGIELIASENFTSRAVQECLGSCLTNKYSEGLPGARYYGGNEIIDRIEILCQQRAIKAFGLDEDEWGVNVQPYSGSPANFEAYTSVLPPHGRLMGLDLPSGGHLTHGFYSPKKKVSASSLYFESLPYRVDPATGLIDFTNLLDNARLFRPGLIVAGASAYPRQIDFSKFREICDEVGAVLLVDMAHIAGLVASGVHPSPFPHADLVTSTSHKTLRGPRSGLIFYNKRRQPSIETRVNAAVFPSLQGGPHNHQIAALAVQLKEVTSSEFRHYSECVVANAITLSTSLMSYGYTIVTNGTDTHVILWDLRTHKLTGSKVQEVCDYCNITLNKNTVPGDVSPMSPGGVRIGTSAMTTRGVDSQGFVLIAEFLHRAANIAISIRDTYGTGIKDFKKGVCVCVCVVIMVGV
eukprot:GHVR01019297.1.p1 GENE.GHVR01019297.1~~GHVR01019297.1.p1  ORF type:complete len:444 (+),score=97.84 GHVR01019297.1:25-1356(+)